jgi:Cys-rich protein (TIGR01571 family)
MYHPLRTWKTNLCNCHCESLSVSYLLPCYVYAKLRKGNYAFHFLAYVCLWLSTQTLYSYNYYLNDHACSAYETDLCAQLEESDCGSHYMKLSSGFAPCVYRANICAYDNYECISPRQYRKMQYFIFVFTFIVYVFFANLNYKLRSEIKQTYEINADECDCLTVVCCPTCALAQSYREVGV